MIKQFFRSVAVKFNPNLDKDYIISEQPIFPVNQENLVDIKSFITAWNNTSSNHAFGSLIKAFQLKGLVLENDFPISHIYLKIKNGIEIEDVYINADLLVKSLTKIFDLTSNSDIETILFQGKLEDILAMLPKESRALIVAQGYERKEISKIYDGHPNTNKFRRSLISAYIANCEISAMAAALRPN